MSVLHPSTSAELKSTDRDISDENDVYAEVNLCFSS